MDFPPARLLLPLLLFSWLGTGVRAPSFSTVPAGTTPTINRVSIRNTACGAITGRIRIEVDEPDRFRYVWTDLAGVALPFDGPEMSGAPGTYTLLLQDRRGIYCDLLRDFVIGTNGEQELAVITQDACTGVADVELDFFAEPPLRTIWVALPDDTIAVDELRLAGLSPGQYRVQVIDRLSCVQTDDFTVVALPALLRIDSVEVIAECGAERAALRVFGGGGIAPVTYTLMDGTPATGNRFTDLPPGSYSIMATDAAGCSTAAFMATVPAFGDPLLRLDTPPTVLLGDSVRLNWRAVAVSDAFTTRWRADPGLSCTDCPFPVARPVRSTTYRLSLTDGRGCVFRDSVRVLVDPRATYYLPTAFSPNGDGVNDVWCFFPGVGVARVLELRVYDRWGGLRYAARDGEVAWDGRVGGADAGAGVYGYAGVMELVDGRREVLGGSFVLVR